MSPPQNPDPYESLTLAATRVASGDYASARQIFELTAGAQRPEVHELAEAFGLMAVKVEAREYRLRQTNVALEEAGRTRAEFGLLACCVIMFLCIYTLLLAVLETRSDLNHRRTLALGVTFAAFSLLALIFWLFVRALKPAPHTYGWSLKGWRSHSVEAVVWSVAAVALMAGSKWLAVRWIPALHGETVIDWHHWDDPFTMFLYFALAPFQETMARGFMQGSIERFLVSRYRTAIAIAVTSLQFGVLHLHFGLSAGFLAMTSGVGFGLLYARQRTLVGVSIAHIIVGTVAFGPLRLLSY